MKTHTTAESLLERIDGLDLPAKSWVATDADGTLWAADVADEACRELLSRRRMLPAAAEAMKAEVEAGGGDSRGEVHGDAALLFDLYMQGRVGDVPLLKAATFCYAGWSEADLRVLGREIAQRCIAPQRFETSAKLLRGIQERGLRLVVVSGSPTILVEEAIRLFGLNEQPPVLGTELISRDGLFADQLKEPITWCAGKVEALRSLLGGAPLTVGFGDTLGDLALLEASSELRVLVNPRPGLRKASVSWSTETCVLSPPRTVRGDFVYPSQSDQAVL